HHQEADRGDRASRAATAGGFSKTSQFEELRAGPQEKTSNCGRVRASESLRQCVLKRAIGIRDKPIAPGRTHGCTARKREDFPCQLGAVHTWHFSECRDVRLESAKRSKADID